jgi:hypothetical protein
MSAPSFTARVWAAFNQDQLTRCYRDILLTLHSYRGPGGVAWPAHSTLASRCRCSVKAVQNALTAARDLGLLSRVGRWVRSGWRMVRSSNLYRFLPQAVELPLSSIAVLLSSFSNGSRQPLPVMGQPDLLALRRAAFAAGQARKSGVQGASPGDALSSLPCSMRF